MQPFIWIARGLSSPAILIAVVWCATLMGVAIGPIDFPGEPSTAVLVLVAVGVALFILAYQAGAWSYRSRLRHQPDTSAPPIRVLNTAVVASAVLGIAGIGLIALDRVVFSGVSISSYAELLRCAPTLVDVIEIKRTPLLYAGYLSFSFAFVSLVLFLLKGEEIRGGAAILAQLSVLAPVGYALIYAGRMPILLVIVLVLAAVLVRIGQGRRPVPPGHHLLIKMVAALLVFGIYTSAMWSSRSNFCAQMNGLVLELQAKADAQRSERFQALQTKQVELERKLALAEQPEETEKIRQELANVRRELARVGQPHSADAISAANLSKMIDEPNASPVVDEGSHSAKVSALLAKMQEAWHVKPREYVLSAIGSGYLPADTAVNLLSTYFYLAHGVRILDVTWHAREQFSPHWGIYQIGILSPILRVFFPQNSQLASMGDELKSTDVLGFFPTVWGAAYIDFGAAGGIIYVLIWGFAAGWSAFGAKRSTRVLPALLLSFVLASILFIPVQGPLGIANSAMVLISMVVLGMMIDLGSLSDAPQRGGPKPEAPGPERVSAP